MARRTSLKLTAIFFPFEKLNCKIWPTGPETEGENAGHWPGDIEPSFDVETRTLITGLYGFGGWEYVVPADWTPYSYLVLELEEPQTCGASFRIYDQESYWTEPSYTDLGAETLYMIDLSSLTKKGADGNPVPLDLTSIYRAGLWSYGGSPIRIKSIYLMKGNADAITSVRNKVENGSCSIYTLSGMKVKANRTEDLRPGIYIVNGKKIAVK